jgi:hypothetical protein
LSDSPGARLDGIPARLAECGAFRLGKPRFVRRDRPYLAVPVMCRARDVELVVEPAIRAARDWLARHDVNPDTPELLDEEVVLVVSLNWSFAFRDRNPAAARPGRLAFGSRYLFAFPTGDMLTGAVEWRHGRGRLRPLIAT